mmetsp:Transcript_28364/g.35085  ORF Transcript_28364/g.35085 Transcript_28364/m.35085 type:complete len:1411 (-) Transcript_28364:240-4472(-)
MTRAVHDNERRASEEGTLLTENSSSSSPTAESNTAAINASECCKSLSTALENGLLLIDKIQSTTDTSDTGTNSVSDRERETPLDEFVSLLHSTKERSAYLGAVRSTKFQKAHARRLFGALQPILEDVITNEYFVPISAFENDNDEEEHTHGRQDDVSNQGSTTATTTHKPSFGSNKRNSEISQVSQGSTSASVKPDPASTKALHFLKYSAMVTHAFLENQISRRKGRTGVSDHTAKNHRVYDIIEEVWSVAEMLHDNLFALNSCGREGIAVQKFIVGMCETYWKGQFTDREVLVTQLVPLLVLKTLDGNATKADIKRLWNMKETLLLLDFHEHESIAFLRSLLLRTISSPLYIKNGEGKKMIAFLFQLDASLIKDLHHSIRAQIPLAKAGILEAYGEIYVTAWKEAFANASERSKDDEMLNLNYDSTDADDMDEIQTTIEENVLQDLMYAALHASTPHMAKSVRAILEPLHNQKKNPTIDSLLYRMYSPLLWRALAAANPLVRIHASTILHTTFPLHEPNAGKTHLKEVNEKTIEVLIRLLNDGDPKVRVAGCDATVRILGVYWDALSAKHIRSLLNEVIMKHANDISSAAVRAQAVHGIALLLDAQASHGVLRPLLPLLGNLIHDSVERVRLACVKLLLKVKKLKGIKYYHVVPSNHILARLAVEGEGLRKPTGPVASALTELLLNSYFPQHVKGSEQMRRTLHFIHKSPSAARVFYANIGRHLEINNTSKLIVIMIKTIKLAINREKSYEESRRKKRNRVDDGDETLEDEEDNDTEGMEVIASNTHLMAGLADTICTVWTSISSDLIKPENINCLEFVQSSISGTTLTELCTHFEGYLTDIDSHCTKKDECDRICASLLCCAGYMSSENIEGLCEYLSTRIKTYGEATSGERDTMSLIPYLATLCSWGMENEVAASLGKSIKNAFDEIRGVYRCDFESATPSNEEGNITRSKRKQSSLHNQDENSSAIFPLIPGDAALQIIGFVISGKDVSTVTTRDAILSSDIACNAIENALENATTAADNVLTGMEKLCNDDRLSLILLACEIHGRFALHKQAFNNYPIKMSSQARDFFIWITNRVVKNLSQWKEKEDMISTMSPFQDLNLSRISAVGSRHSEVGPPLSPLPISPPRRRSNLNSSPSNMDASFISMEKRGGVEFTVTSDISSSTRSHVMAISLIKSAINIYSEWLLVGVEVTSEMRKYVLQWCQIMKHDFVKVKSELFPSFCRLAIIFGKLTFEYDLLSEVLSVFDTRHSACKGLDEIISKVIHVVLSIRDSESSKHALSFVQTLLKASEMYLNYDPETINTDLTNDADIEDLSLGKNLGLMLAVEAIMNHQKGVVLLIKMLLDHLKTGKQDNLVFSFHKNMLTLSCQKLSHAKAIRDAKVLLRAYEKNDSDDLCQYIKVATEAIS